jgi:hypothetical protein
VLRLWDSRLLLLCQVQWRASAAAQRFGSTPEHVQEAAAEAVLDLAAGSEALKQQIAAVPDTTEAVVHLLGSSSEYVQSLSESSRCTAQPRCWW